MWKIYYKGRVGGQNSDFWGKKLQDLDVGYAKQMGKQDYMSAVFLKYLPRKGRILDAGCGIGQHVLSYRDLGYQIEGIDFSQQAIDLIVKFDATAPCRQGNVLKIDAPDSSYDCYYSLGVFEHFEEGPEAAIEEAKRLLSDNGIFMLTMPYQNTFRKIKFTFLDIIRKLRGESYIITNIGFIKRANQRHKPDKHPDGIMKFHEYIYTRKEIMVLLASKGFKIEYYSPCSIIWGLLELPLMHEIYKYFDVFLKRKNMLSESAQGFERTKKINLLKDILIYEKRDSRLKYFFVDMLAYLFGNLFLVVCRKS